MHTTNLRKVGGLVLAPRPPATHLDQYPGGWHHGCLAIDHGRPVSNRGLTTLDDGATAAAALLIAFWISTVYQRSEISTDKDLVHMTSPTRG